MAEISLQEYREQIDVTIEEGRYGEAVAHGKHILKQYPKDVASYQLLGKAMLNSGQSDDAIDMFRRVLGANPEDLVAWIGMSEVYSKRGEFDAAAWHLERAFEQASDNEILENELRKLYGQRDGKEPQRIQLTRGALARLYLKGDLLSRAINEFRDLLTEHPERVDLSIALAEALWRNEQRLEASEVCQKLLDELPYCIKANLILGEIWTSSGREEEGQTYLRRAEALDPENQMAQILFGASSPLQLRETHITPLEPETLASEERPAWMIEGAEEGGALADVASALETQIEMPSWLQDAAGKPAIADQAPVMTPPEPIAAEPLFEQPPVAPPIEEAIPDWLTGMGDEFSPEEPGVTPEGETETAEWLTDVGLETTSPEETLDPLAALGIGAVGAAAASTIMDGEEAPDWLPDLGFAPVSEDAPPSVPPSQEPAPDDWLAGIRDQFTEEEESPTETVPELAKTPSEQIEPNWLEKQPTPPSDESLSRLEQPTDIQEQETSPATADIPDWMQQLAPSDTDTAPAPDDIPDWLQEPAVSPDKEVTLAPADIPDWMQELEPLEKAPTPDWLADEETAPSDETLGGMEQAAPSESDELETQARIADIFGRPASTEPPTVEETSAAQAEIPDWMQEIEPPDVSRPEAEPLTTRVAPEESIAPPTEGIFGRAAFEEPEPSLPITTEEEPTTPDWLESEGVPSGDDALAWLEQLTEGKEDELEAQAQAEGEARMAEIMGRPAPVVETAPEEAIAPPVEEASPTPADIPDWMQELAPSEEAVPAAPVAKEEPSTPDWLESEGVPSGDDALAWLEQLTEGKEDELEAQAQAEGEARMAEIMGRPAPTVETAPEKAIAPPVEETPPAPADAPDWMQELGPPEETVPATPVAEEPITPDWLESEGVPSGDDALAWLEQLTAGKEDELKAQAQAEGEARMAEIMGRPAPTVETAPEEAIAPPVEETPFASADTPDWMQELGPSEETVPATPIAEEPTTPDWLESEGVPSGDDALAWLEQLTAGKEDELQAQAQAEAEARMAEIMGRPAPTVETAPEEAIASPVEETPPAPADIPDWMQEHAPSEDVDPVTPVAEEEPATPDWLESEGVPSGDDALAWLEQLTAGKEDELQAQAQAEAEARMAEIMGRPAPVVETAPEETIAPPVEEAHLAPAEESDPVAPVVEEEPSTPDWLESEGVPSGDDALAWLEQLAAGKEDELQAQAQAEGEARMAEIMGRPAPIVETVPEETIAPPVEEAPPAPADIPDWMQELAPSQEAIQAAAVARELPTTPDRRDCDVVPSGDDALAWLEQLTEGKEDELEAQAQAEGEARMAEIMGHPAPVAETAPEETIAPPVEEAPPAPADIPDWMQELAPSQEAIPAAPIAKEEPTTPDWLEDEGIPSGDDALAWLEQLTEGKEDELQAQAQAEGKVRMAEIMGRPAPATVPVVEAAMEEIVAPPVEEIVLAVEAAPIPDQLEDGQITAAPVEEAFGWMAFSESQISPQAQAEAEAQAQMVEVIEPPAPIVETIPEEIPPVAEVVPEKITAPPVEETVPLAQVPEIEKTPTPEVAFEPAPPLPVKDTAITPPPAVEQTPNIVEAEAPTPPEPRPAKAPPSADPFAAERAYLKKHPRDYDAWMELARGLWQADMRAESLEAYGRLIRASKSLEHVIADLESYRKQWPGVDVQQALGDAYMKNGRLQEALDIYKEAIRTL
ncbi:MAG: tetratricopeptide repeat protein [Chloroflexi bacterium]|nr:tetratricopeptide repeat protein [Chloroflexota bacterium]